MSEVSDQDEQLPPFEETPEVEPEEFRSAFFLYANAAVRKVLVQNPARETLRLLEEDGSVGSYRLTDNKMSRGVTAIHNRYREDPQKYSAVLTRVFALTKLMGADALGEWCVKTASGFDMHDAVIDAAAAVKLEETGLFPHDEFLRGVESIAEEKYPEA
jgi:hypothetical protein